MKNVRPISCVIALGLAVSVTAVADDALASGRGKQCARHETVASGRSGIHRRLAKIDAEVAWELKVVEKYGLLWYSWWNAANHRFICRDKGRHTVCVARGKPCRLL